METQLRRAREEMVERQIASRGITDPVILDAFRQVPREQFVPEGMEEFAYEDTALPIGEGQTISQPYIVACMMNAAGASRGDTILEVGAGSGYAAAVLSRIAGQVFAIERHEKLARQAHKRIERLGYTNCSVIAADGMEGLPDCAPFDAILVAARIGKAPEALKQQLRIGGKLIIPLGGEEQQQLQIIERMGESSWRTHDIAPVRFVPLLEGFVAESASRPEAEEGEEAERPLARVIADAAQPLPAPHAPGFAEAFDRYAEKRVVMLGECSHGTHEFYQARAAITRRLVEKHGFTVVAVEGDWPDAAVYDRYVRGQEPVEGADPPFQRFPTWMWRNTVMPDLLKDLRAINEGRDAANSAGFYGLDIYNMAGSIEAVLTYLDAHDPEAAKVARERYGCLTPWQAEPTTYGRAALRRGFAECEPAVVAQCRDLLQRAIEQDHGAFGAAMNARLIASAEKYYRVMYYGGAESWNLRDSHMFETLQYLLERDGEGTKAVVWAHNSHIGDARATEMGGSRGEHNLGQLAREKWGADVALIGFGTHSGTVSAANEWGGEREIMPVRPSRSDSYERLCHEAGMPRFLLDLSADAAMGERLNEPRLMRYIGVIYRPETERQSHYSAAMMQQQFDAYCWFDETSALQPMDGHEPSAELAQTYPFGV